MIQAIYYVIVGTTASLIIRMEISESGEKIITKENINVYNVMITLHGLVMVFYAIMPGLISSFGNILLPINIGSAEVVYPRGNISSVYIFLSSFVFALIMLIVDNTPGSGWTLYPPLITSLMNVSPTGVDLLIIAIVLISLSSFLTSTNFITTINYIKSPNIILENIGYYNWALYFTSILLIICLPILLAGGIMILTDLHGFTQYYDNSGDPVLFQHLFWFFGHPEVYIIILPAFGKISEILEETSTKLIFGYKAMILAMGCISILGSIVWAHHMVTVGLESDTRAYFTASTILISIPTGTKIFNWVTTQLGIKLNDKLSMILVTYFIILFTLGGTTGVILGNGAVDVALHDTYYVVAHFHYTLSLGAVIGTISMILFEMKTILGTEIRTYKTRELIVILFCVFITIGFLIQHMLGFNVLPRRITECSDSLNSVTVLATILIYISVLSFIFVL